ncbi:hypothetical protein, partial [Gluconobacter thailandicus]
MSETNNGGTPAANTGYLASDLIGMALEQLGVGVGGQNADPQGLASGVNPGHIAPWYARLNKTT